jgi:thiosulfate/3-mercaptopyruvate sulfurtransferase
MGLLMSQQYACLISVKELADCYKNSDVIIVDCRFSLADIALGERQFYEGHIVGAQYLHLERDLSAQKSQHGGRHPLPDPELLVQRFRAIGINKNSLVVCYDDQRFAFASRLWWLLRWLGHSNVVVLNGGFKAWQAAGFPVENTLNSAYKIGDFDAKINTSAIVDRHVAATTSSAINSVLIDSREAPRYRGEQEPIDPIAGHIPGAINKPWADVTDANGFALDLAAQQQRWGDVAEVKNKVVYCGSGVTACVNILSLAMIGCDDAKLYSGSWSDWCSYIL